MNKRGIRRIRSCQMKCVIQTARNLMTENEYRTIWRQVRTNSVSNYPMNDQLKYHALKQEKCIASMIDDVISI